MAALPELPSWVQAASAAAAAPSSDNAGHAATASPLAATPVPGCLQLPAAMLGMDVLSSAFNAAGQRGVGSYGVAVARSAVVTTAATSPSASDGENEVFGFDNMLTDDEDVQDDSSGSSSGERAALVGNRVAWLQHSSNFDWDAVSHWQFREETANHAVSDLLFSQLLQLPSPPGSVPPVFVSCVRLTGTTGRADEAAKDACRGARV